MSGSQQSVKNIRVKQLFPFTLRRPDLSVTVENIFV